MKKDDDQNQKNDDVQKQIDEANNKYLRALADYQNLEKQTEDWKRDFTKYASANLIVKLLEVLDDLEKAQETLKNDGLALVIGKFKKLLESEGLEVLELEGKQYDPNLAEVVSMDPGETGNSISKVLQKGYKMGDRIIRPAKVIVTTKTSGSESESN